MGKMDLKAKLRVMDRMSQGSESKVSHQIDHLYCKSAKLGSKIVQ